MNYKNRQELINEDTWIGAMRRNARKSSIVAIAIIGTLSGVYGCSSNDIHQSENKKSDSKLTDQQINLMIENIAGSRKNELKQAEFVGYHLVNQAKQGATAQALMEFWHNVKERTEGKLSMTVLPKDAYLPGSDGEAFLNTANGRFNAITINAPALTNVMPQVFNIMTLMFAFKDSNEGLQLTKNKVFRRLLVEAGEEFNVTFLPNAILNAGMRVVTSTKEYPFKDSSDIKGFKLRIPPSNSIAIQLKSLGVEPVQTPIGQLIKTLKSKKAYGQENPPSYIPIFKINTVQHTIWETNHVWSGFVTGINSDTWNSWPKEWQQIVREEAKLMQDAQWKRVASDNKQALKEAPKTMGMKVMKTNFESLNENESFNQAREEIVKTLDPELQVIARKIINGTFETVNN